MTIVKADVPNFSLKDPSLTARVEPFFMGAMMGQRSGGREIFFMAFGKEAGGVVERLRKTRRMFGNRDGSWSQSDGQKLRVPSLSVDGCAAQVLSEREGMVPPWWYRRFKDG